MNSTGSDGVVNPETLMRFALAFAALVGFASGAEAALVVDGGIGVEGFSGGSRSVAGDPVQPVGAAVMLDWSNPAARPDENIALHWSAARHAPFAGSAHPSPEALGAALDNVELSAVPDATSWGLLLAGFGLVGVIARRRRDTRSVTA
jgi:MYXO-CTERM domain-containing protein